MGINPTPTNFKTFTFDGENSRDYGVYITGEGVFNAPERNVEMVEIHGRNGAFALDHGNFNNIEVTYPAGIVADNEADFAEAVSDLRNLLCSKVGYVRLEDDYNPNEYRLAIYKSGLEVDHEMLINGEFDLVFDCKPQRYLKSGETPISVTSGDTITNPTRFDSQPLLQFNGYGAINLGDTTINVDDVPLGQILLYPSSKETVPASASSKTITISFDENFVNPSDALNISSCNCGYLIYKGKSQYDTCVASDSSQSFYSEVAGFNSNYATIKTTVSDLPFVCGVSGSVSNTTNIYFNKTGGGSYSFNVTLQVSYDGAHTITYTITKPSSDNGGFNVNTGNLFAISTVSVLLYNTAYIDCDIGECYIIKDDEVVTLNNATQLPAELPTLQSGANTITYDNTFTSFEIVPRWWKV